MRIKNKLTTTIFFSLVLLLSSCQSSSKTNISNNKSSGDWPSYSFEELVLNSDLVVYGKIVNSESINSSPPSQESKINIIKLLKGDENKTIVIKLSDPTYYVKINSKYVMFLDNTGAYYTQKTFNSLLEEVSGKVSSNIQGFSGEYTIDEVQSEILNILANQ
jgi:hypothetical protein